MSVRVQREGADAPLTDAQVVEAVEAALRHGGRPGLAVDVCLVGDETLAELHGRFLGDPSPTDVMAFDLGDEPPGPAAEIYASIDQALRTASERGVAPARELALYLVHGALHLCGYDDHREPERGRMRLAERTVLTALGYPDDPAPHDRETDERGSPGTARRRRD